jgi:PAS domain S-box-containing protein
LDSTPSSNVSGLSHKADIATASDTAAVPDAALPRVLLVDDQPARLLTYESILEGVGVACVRALSGKEALERLLQQTFAVILLDVSMPEMDGFELARLVREHPRFERTPIIFITGVHVSELDTLRGYAVGAIDYISVPIVPEILRSKVALLVELYRRRKDLEALNQELTAARERLESEHASVLAAAQGRREREWLAAVLNSISDQVYFTDSDGRYTYANPAALAESGRKFEQGVTDAERVAGLEILRPDGSPQPIDESPPLRALRGEIIRNEEQLVRIPETRDLRHRQVSSAPVRDAKGAIIGAVSVARDVTDIEQLRRLERERAQLLDISSDAIFVWELDGAIQYWNRGAADLYGFSSAEAVGRVSHDLLSTLHPHGIYNVVAQLRQEGSWRGELTHRTKSGTDITVQSSMHVVSRDTQILVMESNRDLTEHKQNEQMLREAGRRKDEFLAILSHELRNPLAPIRNVSALLNLPNAQEAQLQWARQVLQRQVIHMSRLLDDLLDVARITHGRLIVKKEPVSLNEVAEVAIDTIQALIDEKGHRLLVRLPEATPMLNADPVRFAQALSNLLVNSAKYTDRGGLIELSGHIERSVLFLSVKDNGIGIPPERIPQLFIMFSGLESTRARHQGGLGIGLALAKEIIELHGGTIAVKSAGHGTGSEFQIRLPLLGSQ